MPTLLLRHAQVLVTMDGQRREIADGALFARDGVIEAVLPGGEWRADGTYWVRSPLRADANVGSFHVTEAGLFKNAGIPTVVCGPGSIQQAHQPDEFVSLEQLARCEAFMQGLANTQSMD